MRYVRLKCDACNWSHRSETATVSYVKSWLNVPCPQCGRAAIITRADLRIFRIFSIVGMISRWLRIASLGHIKTYNAHIDSAKIKRDLGLED